MTTTPAPLPSTSGSPALDRFFAALRNSPLVRSQNRVFAGVCSGIAERLGVSTTLVRVAAVVTAIFGPAVVLYLAAWLLLPDAQGGIRLEKAIRGGDVPSIVLLVITALAILPDAGMHAHGGFVLPLVLIAAVGFFVWGKSSRRGSHHSAPMQSSQGTQNPWWQAASTPDSQTGTGATAAPGATGTNGPQDSARL